MKVVIPFVSGINSTAGEKIRDKIEKYGIVVIPFVSGINSTLIFTVASLQP